MSFRASTRSRRRSGRRPLSRECHTLSDASPGLERIAYQDLNSRQRENYNFLKLSAVLADYGFMTLRLTDDWQGADFIAQHIDGETFLKVQLKGRPTIDKRYMGKDLYIAFRVGDRWCLYPHDEVAERILESTDIAGTASWSREGGYSFPAITDRIRPIFEPYFIAVDE